VSAQLEDQLSSYTGQNASGYLEPLVDAFAADLNAGLYHSAHISRGGFQASIEILFMSVFFTDEDRTFTAKTEGGFQPSQQTHAPTVIGAKKAVYVDGVAGTRFAFPGGFDLDSFSFAVPQLRLGSLYGTEALIRFGLYYTGNADVETPMLYGFGLRHSVSQYVRQHVSDRFPVGLAVGAFWQRFSMGENERGDDLVSADALSVGLHMSKRFERLEPYAGVSYETFSTDVSYIGDSPDDEISLALESQDHVRLTLGLTFNIAFVVAHGEYNIGGQNAFALGLALQHRPSK
jgi:hypothetical protein